MMPAEFTFLHRCAVLISLHSSHTKVGNDSSLNTSTIPICLLATLREYVVKGVCIHYQASSQRFRICIHHSIWQTRQDTIIVWSMKCHQRQIFRLLFSRCHICLCSGNMFTTIFFNLTGRWGIFGRIIDAPIFLGGQLEFKTPDIASQCLDHTTETRYVQRWNMAA